MINLITRSKKICRLGRSLKMCGTIHCTTTWTMGKGFHIYGNCPKMTLDLLTTKLLNLRLLCIVYDLKNFTMWKWQILSMNVKMLQKTRKQNKHYTPSFKKCCPQIWVCLFRYITLKPNDFMEHFLAQWSSGNASDCIFRRPCMRFFKN